MQFFNRNCATLFVLLQIALTILTLSPVAVAEDVVEFHHDIKPLLSDRCFNCHGPDQEAREADLNLNDKQVVFTHESESGLPLITKGNPDQSEVFQRIASSDPDVRMPPALNKLGR